MTGREQTSRWDAAIAAIIDHTVLRASATGEDIRAACADATTYGFAAVVVAPYYVPLAVKALEGSGVRSCSVVSFPLGAQPAGAKREEARRLLESGVDELDMVMNVGAYLAGDEDAVRGEVVTVAELCGGRALLKVIIETAYLGPAQITRATEVCVEAGADFVKTSSGFAPRGATVEDVRMMKEAAAGRAGIKASGGIRTREFAMELIRAGATRIGCSASLDVIALRPTA